MRVALFCHSLLSDWNHGNAHFLRGLVSELEGRGHPVRVFEPHDAWSLEHLLAEQGPAPVERLGAFYPRLAPVRYDLATLDLDRALDGIELVLVHEWNDRALVARIGEQRRRRRGLRALFHDTHHRAITDRSAMAGFELSGYDGVLAFGRVIADAYRARGWARRAWVFHEAADPRVFLPLAPPRAERDRGDVVWIGNFGDDERTAELREYLIEPIRRLGLRAAAYGVRYPASARSELAAAGIVYRGWVANFDVPSVYARFRATVHIPRGPYARRLPGIPTIRPFEALACGIPLVSAPWDDREGLFSPGLDYLVARSGEEMRDHLRRLLAEPQAAAELAAHGRATVLARHTCGHRAAELLTIAAELGLDPRPADASRGPR